MADDQGKHRPPGTAETPAATARRFGGRWPQVPVPPGPGQAASFRPDEPPRSREQVAGWKATYLWSRLIAPLEEAAHGRTRQDLADGAAMNRGTVQSILDGNSWGVTLSRWSMLAAHLDLVVTARPASRPPDGDDELRELAQRIGALSGPQRQLVSQLVGELERTHKNDRRGTA